MRIKPLAQVVSLGTRIRPTIVRDLTCWCSGSWCIWVRARRPATDETTPGRAQTPVRVRSVSTMQILNCNNNHSCLQYNPWTLKPSLYRIPKAKLTHYIVVTILQALYRMFILNNSSNWRDKNWKRFDFDYYVVCFKSTKVFLLCKLYVNKRITHSETGFCLDPVSLYLMCFNKMFI